MRREYPVRPKMAAGIRFGCMIFGVICFGGTVYSVCAGPLDLVSLLGGLLVSGVWFGFGWYGGLPLVDTVRDWRPPTGPNEINDMHRRGLLVIRRREWIMWASIPLALAVGVSVIPICLRLNQPGLVVLIVGVPYLIIVFRHFLSRCPRCGYGFFTRSTSRGAFLEWRKACGHCGLPLRAYEVGRYESPNNLPEATPGRRSSAGPSPFSGSPQH